MGGNFGLALHLHILHASTDRDFDTVFATLVRLRAGGLVVGNDPFVAARNQQLGALALGHAVPSISFGRNFVAAASRPGTARAA